MWKKKSQKTTITINHLEIVDWGLQQFQLIFIFEIISWTIHLWQITILYYMSYDKKNSIRLNLFCDE